MPFSGSVIESVCRKFGVSDEASSDREVKINCTKKQLQLNDICADEGEEAGDRIASSSRQTKSWISLDARVAARASSACDACTWKGQSITL